LLKAAPFFVASPLEFWMRAIFFAFAMVPLVAGVTPVEAQPRNYLQRPTTVSVQYALRFPLKSDDVAEQERVMEEGRKKLYAIGAKECAAILATLASSCKLSRFNISTNMARQRADENAVTLSANAQYEIELQSADGAQAVENR